MESLLDWARRVKSEAVRKGLKNYNWIRKQNRQKKLKGSKKDPFLYLGLMAVVLLGIISFVPFSYHSALSFFDETSQQKERTFLVPNERIQESPELNFVQENSLVAISPPIMVTPQVLGALAGATDYEQTKKEITEYIVEPGDNLLSIAEKFNISLETLVWANDLKKNSLLQIGQKLVILPVSGVIHHVQKDDTLSEIAKIYKADLNEIMVFNDLTEKGNIYIGDILIIPEGIMPSSVKYAPASVPLASSYFICPVSQPCRITQGLHWYNAIDFSNGKCGEPIYAVAAGEVLKVSLTNSISRWAFGGAGNHLTIIHPNGVVTMYGHLQMSFVKPGDYVSQGQIIALMGGTPHTPGAGNSTGCHVHFTVLTTGTKNPFAR